MKNLTPQATFFFFQTNKGGCNSTLLAKDGITRAIVHLSITALTTTAGRNGLLL